MSSMFFDIECGNKITYFDVPLHGNFGYNGIEKMKNKISKLHDSYFFIQDNSNVQFANELNDIAILESNPALEGKTMIAMLSPIKK